VAANMEVDHLSRQYFEMCITRPDTWTPDGQPSICAAVRDTQSDAVWFVTHGQCNAVWWPYFQLEFWLF